jgi:hypothetical protein
MNADTALDHLTRQLNEKVIQLQEALADGRVDTFEEYRKVCGEVKGLLTALSYVTDLKRKLEHSDDN